MCNYLSLMGSTMHVMVLILTISLIMDLLGSFVFFLDMLIFFCLSFSFFIIERFIMLLVSVMNLRILLMSYTCWGNMVLDWGD